MIHIGTVYSTLLNKSFAQISARGITCVSQKHLSLEEAKTVYSQKRPQSGATEGTLYRLYMSLPRQRPNPHAQKYNLFKLERTYFLIFNDHAYTFSDNAQGILLHNCKIM